MTLPFPLSFACTPCSRNRSSLCRIVKSARCSSYRRCPVFGGVETVSAVGNGIGSGIPGLAFALSVSSFLPLSSPSPLPFCFASRRSSFALCSATTLAMSSAEGPVGVGSGIAVALQVSRMITYEGCAGRSARLGLQAAV